MFFCEARREFTEVRSAGLITWEFQGGPREGPESGPIGGAKDRYTKDLAWMVQTDRRGLLCQVETVGFEFQDEAVLAKMPFVPPSPSPWPTSTTSCSSLPPAPRDKAHSRGGSG
jgi:hypothetical protein